MLSSNSRLFQFFYFKEYVFAALSDFILTLIYYHGCVQPETGGEKMFDSLNKKARKITSINYKWPIWIF